MKACDFAKLLYCTTYCELEEGNMAESVFYILILKVQTEILLLPH